MKRIVDWFILVLLASLFVASIIMAITGAWWNLAIAGGIIVVGIALYCEIVSEENR